MKPKWLDDHTCRFNDGIHCCDCFVEGYSKGLEAQVHPKAPNPVIPSLDIDAIMDSFALEGKITEKHAQTIREILCEKLAERRVPGVGQWKEIGEPYGYDKYFKIKF